MTIAIASVIAFLFIAYGVRWWVIRGAIAQDGAYDNNQPRLQQAGLKGKAGRAQAAHQNSLEAFAPFAAAVLVAQGYSDLDAWRDALAVAFVVVRLVYVQAYLGDWGNGRSLVWSVGFAIMLALFCLPLAG